MTDDQFRREYADNLVEQVKNGRMTRRQLLVRASIFGFSLAAAGQLLAACGGSGSSSPSASASASAGGAPAVVRGGTLKAGVVSPVTALDPLLLHDTGGGAVIMQFCEYLAWMSDDFSLQPMLAQSWSPNQDATVWTFKLQQGVKFSDGSPFEAEDVVVSLDRVCDPKSGSNALNVLGGILVPGGTKKVDQYTVTCTLEKPCKDFPYRVSSAAYNTVILKRDFPGGDWVKHPVGTGPWLLKDYVPKVSFTAVKNPTYWRKDASGGALPYMDQVDWVMINDQSAYALQLQSGAIDLQEETIYQGMQALASDPNLKILEYPSTFFLGTHMNVTKAPFDDKRVRQAVAYCMDRNSVNTVLYNDKATIANDTVFSEVFPGSPKSPPARTQDYAKAKQLLADAGHPSGLSVTLSAYKNIEVPQYAQLIKEQCAPGGININIQMYSYDQYYSGNPAPWLSVPFGITEYAPRPTPGMITNFLLLPNAVWNSSHWSNAEFATLYDQYMKTVDEAKSLEIATKMAAIQYDDTPELLTEWVTALRAMKKNVYGVKGPGSLFISLAETYKA